MKPIRIAAWLALIVVVLTAVNCSPSKSTTKPHKALVHTVFYIGMSADEALARLPAGCTLDELSIYWGYGPEGPTPTELQNNQEYAISDRNSQLMPLLFFNEKKQLIFVGPAFDEEKYVRMYEARMMQHGKTP